MPHDGQDVSTMTEGPILDGLLDLTAEAVAAAEAYLDRALAAVRAVVTVDGRVSPAALDTRQTAAHGLAWVATYVEALRQMQGWAGRLQDAGQFGETERLIHQIAFGEYLCQLRGGLPMSQGEILRAQDLGLSAGDLVYSTRPRSRRSWRAATRRTARSRLVEIMRDQRANVTVGRTGLDDELEMIREQFRRASRWSGWSPMRTSGT